LLRIVDVLKLNNMDEDFNDASFLVDVKTKDQELQDKIKSGEIKVCSVEDEHCESCSG